MGAGSPIVRLGVMIAVWLVIAVLVVVLRRL
jgi:hypothetical protein